MNVDGNDENEQNYIENQEISQSEKDELLNEINRFTKWLVSKEIVYDSTEITNTFDLPYADEDWIMKVDTNKNRVSFNTYIRQKCSFEYYKIVILHEFFHLVVQKVPNKDDATKIKDDFGAGFMKLIDIEADFYIALYLKEIHNYTLVKYWEINYEGGTVFVDKWIRSIKFERFIGTLLSICKMFMTYPENGEEFKAYDLYLPTLNPIYTEDSLHVLIIKKEHIYFDEIEANYSDFAKLKECYKDVRKYTIYGYVEELIRFSSKALKLDITKNIELEIDNLKNQKS